MTIVIILTLLVVGVAIWFLFHTAHVKGAEFGERSFREYQGSLNGYPKKD
jgi:hypothetical protein